MFAYFYSSLIIVSSMDILKYCKEPCQFSFPVEKGSCGHTCKGNCSQCLHGRLHVKCQEECGKTLICGHRCNFPCSSNCPPCQKQCIFSCEHSKCKANCGEPCVQCTVSSAKVFISDKVVAKLDLGGVRLIIPIAIASFCLYKTLLMVFRPIAP